MSRYQTVTIVAIDLEHASLRLVAGREEPKSDRVPGSHRTGLVPLEDHERLVAVLNGGWKSSHGHWGFRIGADEYLPPREQGCTVAIHKDGAVRVRPWSAVVEGAPDLAALLQVPPCILTEKQLHPELEAQNDRRWGGHDPQIQTRRRSAIGVDATGRVLFYAFGEEVGPRLLAEGMRAAGAVEAAQLDINWTWTRFLLFGVPPAGGPLQVTSTLVPKMVHARRGYVESPSDREFFYVARR